MSQQGAVIQSPSCMLPSHFYTSGSKPPFWSVVMACTHTHHKSCIIQVMQCSQQQKSRKKSCSMFHMNEWAELKLVKASRHLCMISRNINNVINDLSSRVQNKSGCQTGMLNLLRTIKSKQHQTK